MGFPDFGSLEPYTNRMIPMPIRGRPEARAASNRDSLRRRFMRSISHRRPSEGYEPAGFGTTYAATQEQEPSRLRKSISSISSSLRGRFSLDSSLDSEGQSRQSSMIRKSFGSMSSPLRGIRSSMSSGSSQEKGRHFATIQCRAAPKAQGYYPGRPRCHSFGQASDGASEHDSVPRLPRLDEMIVGARGGETSTEYQSTNTLFSMSIFDGLGVPFDKRRPEEANRENVQPPAKQSTTAVGRLPVRLKRPDPVVIKSDVPQTPSANIGSVAAKDSSSLVCSNEAKNTPNGTTWTSKIPKEWLDHVLETSISMRKSVSRARRSTAGFEVDENWRRRAERVYVSVPEGQDQRQPRPKARYPNFDIAIGDLLWRFKPYYAPFATYTWQTRTICLFPPGSIRPEHDVMRDTFYFNLMDALEGFGTISHMRRLFGETNDEKREPEEDAQEDGSLPRAHDMGYVELEGDSDDGLLGSEGSSTIDGDDWPPMPNRNMLKLKPTKSVGSLQSWSKGSTYSW
ncbi:hypothetical protein AAE478_003149 [Parahypoxylon ruwenzoriense]